jgi:hypothetical protein
MWIRTPSFAISIFFREGESVSILPGNTAGIGVRGLLDQVKKRKSELLRTAQEEEHPVPWTFDTDWVKAEP